MKTKLITVRPKDGESYPALKFVCPGCRDDGDQSSGLNILPVNTQATSPAWTWDGNLEAPTIEPSIHTLSGPGMTKVCHSFLRSGAFQFLGDCTHQYANQVVPMPDLPDWAINKYEEDVMDVDKLKKASELEPGDRLEVKDGVWIVDSVTGKHHATREIMGVTRVHFKHDFYLDYPPGAVVALE